MTTFAPSAAPTASGFWSYVHKDDDASYGRITQLARDIVVEYEAQTTETVQLFLDRDDLEWGDRWREVIDEALASVAFFVPVVTPRFFQSVECRRELKQFAERAEALGVRQLIMPILWIDVPDLADPSKYDDVMQMIVDFQWEPLTTLRHAERGAPEYTKAVEKLAARIVAVNAMVDKLDIAVLAASSEEEEENDDDSPGVVDRLAEMEDAMPSWNDSMGAMTADIEAIGEIAAEGTVRLESGSSQAGSFAGRLLIIRQLAQDLQVPASSIEAHGGEFAASLEAVDRGVQIIIEQAKQESAENPEGRVAYEAFFSSLRNLDAEAQGAVVGTGGMLRSIQPLSRMSRDLKKPMRAIENGLVRVQEGASVIHGWIEQIDRLGWDHSDSE